MKASPYKAGYACAFNYPEMAMPSKQLIIEAWPLADDQIEWIMGYQAGIEDTIN